MERPKIYEILACLASTPPVPPEEAFPYVQTKTCNDPKDPSSQRVSVFWSKRRGGGGGRKRKHQGLDSHGGNDSG